MSAGVCKRELHEVVRMILMLQDKSYTVFTGLQAYNQRIKAKAKILIIIEEIISLSLKT